MWSSAAAPCQGHSVCGCAGRIAVETMASNAHLRRRRGRLRRLVATAAVVVVSTLVGDTSGVHLRDERARGGGVGPGRVVAARSADEEHGALRTTGCDVACGGAPVCVSLGVDGSTCQATRETLGVSCELTSSGGSTLCIRPEPSRWRIEITADAEIVALARSNASRFDEDRENEQPTAPVVVLNASDVKTLEDLVLPTDITQLSLTSGGPTEQLDVPISRDLIAAWTSLERLAIRNFDMSNISSLPPLPRLISVTLANTRLKTWSSSESPALSTLDISGNELAELPVGSLPPSLSVLNVSSNNLVSFPVDIASLTGLSRLSLSHNTIAQSIDFPKLPALKELYLSDVGLSTLPSGLANLPALQKLDVSHNVLNGTMSNSFPATLNSLKLRNCQLSVLPGVFGIEKTWEVIDLSENPFSTDAFSTVTLRANNLLLEDVQLTVISPNVKTWAVGNTLSLSRNTLGIVNALDLPSDVAELRLAGCSLGKVPTGLISLRRLEILDLSNNSFSTVPGGSLPVTLSQLFLSGCGLSKLPPDVPSMAGTLEMLDLSFNLLTDLELSNFTDLKTLNLRNNSLSKIPEEVFALSSLRHLDLRGNPIANLSLSQEQVAFLSTLRAFEIDASAFVVSESCAESVTFRGRYTLCTKVLSPIVEPSVTDSPSNSTAPTPGPTTESKTKANQTFNIVLACGVAIVAVISVIVARHPRRSRPSRLNESYRSLESTSHRYAAMDMWEDPDLLRWRVDVLDLALVMQIAHGANSLVWLARYQRETVVVKRFAPRRHDSRLFERFIDEIKCSGRLSHEKIVRFLGVSWTSDSDLQMLLEFMSNGDLNRYLQTSRTDLNGTKWSARKVRIAVDVAEALVYLHSHDPPLLHRDLKSHHVLLDDRFTAKLADFAMGSQREGDATAIASNISGGSGSRSIAPEVLSGGSSHGRAVDMYAFGVILSELDMHELPFSDVTLSNGAPLSEAAMLELLSTGALHPSISPDCPPVIAFLIADCLAFDPHRRPTAEDALQRLLVVLDSFQGLSVLNEGSEELESSRGHKSNDETPQTRYGYSLL